MIGINEIRVLAIFVDSLFLSLFLSGLFLLEFTSFGARQFRLCGGARSSCLVSLFVVVVVVLFLLFYSTVFFVFLIAIVLLGVFTARPTIMIVERRTPE